MKADDRDQKIQKNPGFLSCPNVTSITYIINPLVSCTFADMSRGDRAVASGNLSGSMRANYELGVDEVSFAKL